MKWRYDVGVDVKECYTVSIKQVKVFWGDMVVGYKIFSRLKYNRNAK